MFNNSFRCDKDEDGPIFARYCADEMNITESCAFFKNPETLAKTIKAIPGLASGVFAGRNSQVKHLS